MDYPIVDQNMNIFSRGTNRFGQLGLGHTDYVKEFTQIKNLPLIVLGKRGTNHCLLLDVDGNVWVCGRNDYGQLGTGNNTHISEPIKLTGLPSIVNVDCGFTHSAMLDCDGNVWMCGLNYEGVLGLGLKDMGSVKVPTKIPNIPHIKHVYCKTFCTMLIDVEGCVWVFGNSRWSYLVLGHYKSVHSPIKINNLPKIETGSISEKNSSFLDVEGNVWVCGENDVGQLGLGHPNKISIPSKIPNIPPMKVAKFYRKSLLMLDYDGIVWITGYSAQISIPRKIDFNVKMIDIDHERFVDEEGFLWQYDNRRNSLEKVCNIQILIPSERRFKSTKSANYTF